MSIINQTLRELDARAPAVDTEAGRTAAITVPARRSSRVKTGIVLGVLLAIAALALWLALTPADVPETGHGTRAPAHAPSPLAVSPATPVSEVQIPVAAPAAEPLRVARETLPAATGVEQTPRATPLAPARPAHTPVASQPLLPATEAQHGDGTERSSALDTRVVLPREAKTAAISKQLTKSTPEEEAEARYRKALNLVNKGRDNQARPLLEETLKLAPGHVAARQVLATLLNESGLDREAELIVREGLRVSPDTPWFALSLARLQSSRGDLDEAAATLRSGIDGRGVTADYHATYAAILSHLKHHVEAARQYEQALSQQPGQGTWWMGLGLALSAQGKTSEARAAYGRALQAGNLSENLEDFVRAKLSE